MNDLGLMLMGAALQVTLLALAAVVLYAVAARRGPGAAAPVAAACLGGSVLLTLLTLCPLPSWWALRTSPGADVVTEAPWTAASISTDINVSLPAPEDQTHSAPSGTGVSWSSEFLRRGWERLHQATVSPPSPRWDWPGTAAVILLTGSTLCLLRLLIGLWAIRECRRRSQGIADIELLQLAESLRTAINCPRRVEIRECPDLASPATVGWVRPVVLLPADWRDWSDTERRAVLAHELAHVSRSDFLTGLLARVGVALHFYHPLLHWMAGRLHLQQELAADALAVRFVGGSGSYLRTLAHLALRQDGRPTGWPVPALFSSHGTLMRRIHMLRAKEGVASPSLPRWGRLLLVGPLVAVAIGVSALRSPAQKVDEPAKGADKPPVYERFYAGGFHSSRGFAFRGENQEIAKPEFTIDLVVGIPRIWTMKVVPFRTQVVNPRILNLSQPFKANPNQFSLLGQNVGSTVLNVWVGDPDDVAKQIIYRYKVNVFDDGSMEPREPTFVYRALEDELNKAFPDAYVRLLLMHDKLVVAGKVKDAIEAKQILQIVLANAPETDTGGVAPVVDLLQFPVKLDGKPLQMRFETKESINNALAIILWGKIPNTNEKHTTDRKP